MHRRAVKFLSGFLIPALSVSAYAVSCTTQSQMTAAQRKMLEQSALALADQVQTGNLAAVKAQTLSSVSARFGAIAGSIEAVQPDIRQATLTTDSMYLLQATDLAKPQDTQFFCGVPTSSLIVTISIPNLPPGEYAVTILHATGVPHPQQLTMILAREPATGGAWKLAGFFTRPMMKGGHSGVWFWKEARVYASKKQRWNAWFYYQAAENLLRPVDFLSSPNLQRLQKEAQDVRPADLPGKEPLQVSGDGRTFAITNVHPGELGGKLDLVVTYKGTAENNPVAQRAEVTAVMRALLARHPELATAFHGLWVYESTANNPSAFALELPMSDIKSSVPPAEQRSGAINNPRKQTG